jgi:hypothetical protein
MIWNQMGNKFKLSGLNVRLIELNQGVPLNAMFYLSDLDLVYVRSYDTDANEQEGYLPRDCCRPLHAREQAPGGSFNSRRTGDADSCLANSDEYSLATNTNTLSTNESSGTGNVNGREDGIGKQNDDLANEDGRFKSISSQQENQKVFEENQKLNENNDDDDSVKYHSLTTAELEYDDLNEDQEQVAQPITNLTSVQTKQIKDCVTYELNNITRTVQNSEASFAKQPSIQKYVPQVDSSSYRAADSTHFSITNYQLVNDYEETVLLTQRPNSRLKEESSLIDRQEISPKSLNQCLLNLQSRSRLPISIKSNLNLPIMDHQGPTNSNVCNKSKLSFSNFTYNSPSVQYAHQYTSVLPKINTPKSANKNEFERSHMRRSLDSSLAFGACGAGVARDNRFYAISIDIEGNENANSMDSSVYNRKILNSSNRKLDIPRSIYEKRVNANEQFADLDLKRIELDSLKDSNQGTPTTPDIVHKRTSKVNPHKILEEPEDQADMSTNNTCNQNENNNNVWTVILKHDAQNFQELNVKPGMLVMILREYETWLYVKLVGFENTELNISQQYGIIPRNCAVNLHELLNKNQSLLSATHSVMPTSTHQTKTGQISQITAL